MSWKASCTPLHPKVNWGVELSIPEVSMVEVTVSRVSILSRLSVDNVREAQLGVATDTSPIEDAAGVWSALR
jgi:hypothetical protein